jgi:hypothetical protein
MLNNQTLKEKKIFNKFLDIPSYDENETARKKLLKDILKGKLGAK